MVVSPIMLLSKDFDLNNPATHPINIPPTAIKIQASISICSLSVNKALKITGRPECQLCHKFHGREDLTYGHFHNAYFIDDGVGGNHNRPDDKTQD